MVPTFTDKNLFTVETSEKNLEARRENFERAAARWAGFRSASTYKQHAHLNHVDTPAMKTDTYGRDVTTHPSFTETYIYSLRRPSADHQQQVTIQF